MYIINNNVNAIKADKKTSVDFSKRIKIPRPKKGTNLDSNIRSFIILI